MNVSTATPVTLATVTLRAADRSAADAELNWVDPAIAALAPDMMIVALTMMLAEPTVK